MRGQESPVIKGKIENALARLDRLDLGENDEDVTDVQELVRRENFFMSVASTPPESNYADSFPAPLIRSRTSFGGFWGASGLWVTRKPTRMCRLSPNSWMILETLSPIIRSVAIPDRFYRTLSLRQLVQMAQQRAIYDQNRRLIVSRQTG